MNYVSHTTNHISSTTPAHEESFLEVSNHDESLETSFAENDDYTLLKIHLQLKKMLSSEKDSKKDRI